MTAPALTGEHIVVVRRERRDEIDRSGWPAGPWHDEPDLLEWRSSATPGLPLLAARSLASGAWCGYAGVSKGHPLYGKDWNLADRQLDVHGGVSWSAHCEGHICHQQRPGEPKQVWWFGFDCAHAGDRMLAIEALSGVRLGGTYRRIDYVMSEVESLARQLARMT